MTDLIKENGYFFTDASAPDFIDNSYGDLSVPGIPESNVPEPGETVIEDDQVVSYEDDQILLDHFTYSDGKIQSYLETNKTTGDMILYTFTRTPGPRLEPIGTPNDYQNFAITGEVDNIDDDVADVDIELYEVTETPIAYLDEEDNPVPA